MIYTPPSGDSIEFDFEVSGYIAPDGNDIVIAYSNGNLAFVFRVPGYIPPSVPVSFIFGIEPPKPPDPDPIYLECTIEFAFSIYTSLTTSTAFSVIIDFECGVEATIGDDWQEVIYIENFMSMIV